MSWEPVCKWAGLKSNFLILSPLPICDAVSSPAWMSESGLSAEDEQVILDHLGSSIRVSTRKCPLQIVQLLKML